MEIPPDANPDVDEGAFVRFLNVHRALDNDCSSQKNYLVIRRYIYFKESHVEIVDTDLRAPKTVSNQWLEHIRWASTEELLTHPHPMAQKMGIQEAEFYGLT